MPAPWSGKLSVPPSWATATPAIGWSPAALSAAGPDAVPAAALGEGGLLSSMSVAGMLGSAFGAGAPSALSRTGVRGRVTPIKDLKDSQLAGAFEASGRTNIGEARKRAAPQRRSRGP